MSALMNTYARLPVTFVEGQGVYLTDTQGRQYLDALAGVAVCSLGHAHPRVAEALCHQAKTLVHTSNYYQVQNQADLGKELCRLSGMDKVFFGNSGAEANEAAIKIARAYGHHKGHALPKIMVMENSFHGRTLATLSATGSAKIQAGFEPLVEGFVRVPFNDLAAAQEAFAEHKDLVAVLVEPVQGEGGVNSATADYLPGLAALAKANDALLMVDEIQTGLCRTGKWFAHQHWHIQPDVMTLAKALGNGVPIGACLARGEAAEVFQPGMHGSTYGGNPLATAAALAVLSVMEEEQIADAAAYKGAYLMKSLQKSLENQPGLVEIRGMGLMIGIEFDRPVAHLVKEALGLGLLMNVTRDKVVRLVPPLIMSTQEMDSLVEKLTQVIQQHIE